MKKITEKQSNVLQFIILYIRDKGYPPSIREIGDRFGVNPRAVSGHITALERKGYIKTTPNVARGIKVIER